MDYVYYLRTGATAMTQAEIEALALSPKKVAGDEGTVEERPIADVLTAIRFGASQIAPGVPLFGIRRAKIRFPGTQS